MRDDAPPPIGHNRPPETLQSYLEGLQENATSAVADLNKLVGDYKPKYDTRPTLADNAQTAKAVEMALALNDLISTIDRLVKQNRAPLDEMSALMRTNGAAWTEAGLAFQKEIRDRILAYMRSLPDGETVRTEHGSLALLQHPWRFEITEPDRVPLSLCSPDEKLIKAILSDRSGDTDPPEIPGVRFYRDDILVLREQKP